MIGLGTLLNSASIEAGGVAGRLAGKRFRPSQQESLARTSGVCVMFIAIAGTMEGMLRVDNGSLTAGRSMLVVLSLALGTAVGEVLNIEGLFLRLGEWLRDKTGSQGDAGFVNAFVTASLTVSIRAMAIMGSIQDGLLGDRSTQAVKSVLDFIVIMVMSSSLGRGCAFSAIPVLVLEGGMTLLARLIAPVMTEAAVANLSLIGAILVFCVGINLVWKSGSMWPICCPPWSLLCWRPISPGTCDPLPFPAFFALPPPGDGAFSFTGKNLPAGTCSRRAAPGIDWPQEPM